MLVCRETIQPVSYINDDLWRRKSGWVTRCYSESCFQFRVTLDCRTMALFIWAENGLCVFFRHYAEDEHSWKVKTSIFWCITPCSPLKVNRRFGGTSQVTSRALLATCFHSWSLLGLETICPTETSVDFQRSTWRHIPEDRTLYNHRCGNMKSYAGARNQGGGEELGEYLHVKDMKQHRTGESRVVLRFPDSWHSKIWPWIPLESETRKQETRNKNDCAGKDQQQFTRPTEPEKMSATLWWRWEMCQNFLIRKTERKR
jgi:hypothetical protein